MRLDEFWVCSPTADTPNKCFPPCCQVFQALLMAKLQQEQDPTRARARIDPHLYDTMTRCARPQTLHPQPSKASCVDPQPYYSMMRFLTSYISYALDPKARRVGGQRHVACPVWRAQSHSVTLCSQPKRANKDVNCTVDARRAWRNQVHETVVSSFQCDVSAMLNLMGIAHTVEYTTEVRACA